MQTQAVEAATEEASVAEAEGEDINRQPTGNIAITAKRQTTIPTTAKRLPEIPHPLATSEPTRMNHANATAAPGQAISKGTAAPRRLPWDSEKAAIPMPITRRQSTPPAPIPLPMHP